MTKTSLTRKDRKHACKRCHACAVFAKNLPDWGVGCFVARMLFRFITTLKKLENHKYMAIPNYITFIMYIQRKILKQKVIRLEFVSYIPKLFHIKPSSSRIIRFLPCDQFILKVAI